MTPPLIGIDLGGTKTEGVAILPDGTELLRHRVKTVKGSYEATLQTISDIVDRLDTATGVRSDRIGVGIPGSISPVTGLVRNANSTWINGRPLAVDLAATLNRKVKISNDANCLALSETRDGAAKGAASVFAVILGTGVGGGLVIDGKILDGAHGLGGEWGHIPQPGESDTGLACFCGRRGCTETFLSGPGLLRDYHQNGGEDLKSVEALAARSTEGDKDAKRALEQHLIRLARALAVIVNTVDPEVIVLGGGVSNLPGLAENLPARIAPFVFAAETDKIEIQVRRAQWGDSSGVRGAARLWEITQ